MEKTYLSAEKLLAYRRPEPLEESYLIDELGAEVLIQGVVKKTEREEIYSKKNHLMEAEMVISHPSSGESYTPDEGDLLAACWAAACVAEPKLTPVQWLQFAAEGYDILGEIQIRCYVCSRIMSDPKLTKPKKKAAGKNSDDGEKTDLKDQEIPDGINAAKGALTGDDDPLE